MCVLESQTRFLMSLVYSRFGSEQVGWDFLVTRIGGE
jgi:hypothetical protein